MSLSSGPRGAPCIVTSQMARRFSLGNILDGAIRLIDIASWGGLHSRLVKRRLLALSTAVIVLAVGGGSGVHAQSFFEGKTLRVVVGFVPGGGFDTYARVISRHMGKHIPGTPTIVVENMPGAGSLIAANHLYRVAKPDGLTIGHFNGGLFLRPMLGHPHVRVLARESWPVAAAVKEDSVCALSKASGITSVEKWMASKTPVKLGGVAPGGSPDNNARVLKAALGL